MIVKKEVDIDVVTAARQRIINVFSNGCKVYMSFSGGKDSICLGHLVYSLIQEGKIDPSLLTVQFVDEESMYDDVIDIVKDWRRKFIMAGAKFEWYCLEFMHFNCLNTLTDEEKWMIWDRNEKENWIREMPSFAIKEHPLFNRGVDTYQAFLPRITQDGLQILGVRATESVQRMINIADRKMDKLDSKRLVMPIYDWKDKDVWLYIYRNQLDFPISYVQMWQVGVPKGRLRISQFFAIDTVQSLLKISEFKPDLMGRIEKRQPNAYIACLYWDTEMFHRSTRNRKKLDSKKEDNKNYRLMLKKMMDDILREDSDYSDAWKDIANKYRYLFMKGIQYNISNKLWKKMYEAFASGDFKKRSYRAILAQIFADEKKEK